MNCDHGTNSATGMEKILLYRTPESVVQDSLQVSRVWATALYPVSLFLLVSYVHSIVASVEK